MDPDFKLLQNHRVSEGWWSRSSADRNKELAPRVGRASFLCEGLINLFHQLYFWCTCCLSYAAIYIVQLDEFSISKLGFRCSTNELGEADDSEPVCACHGFIWGIQMKTLRVRNYKANFRCSLSRSIEGRSCVPRHDLLFSCQFFSRVILVIVRVAVLVCT